MKYQEYKKKMEKIAKVLNVLYRFRFPIGGTILVILAGSLTLTGLSGKAQNVILENTELVYGQSVTAYGKSIFGDAEIQYSKINEDNWSTEVPYRAGSYKARGVSKNGFGQTTYTDTVDFSIAPKPLNVSLSATTITYGDELSYTSDVLKERGDKLESINFTYGEEFDQENPFGENETFDTKVRYDVSSVKILDVNNEDVTYCYDLNVSDLDLKVKKRQLKLVSTETRKEYDGTSLTNENYYISNDTSLASGDEISVTPASITEIGSTSLSSDSVTVMHGSKNRTKFYNIVWDAPGTLTIVKRKLTINTNNINRSYNGRMLSDSADNSDDKLEYTQTGLLTELGHEIKDVVFASQGAYKPISGSPNAITSYAIVDENGADVKDHYDITINEGTINITKVPLVVTYDQKERYYDFTSDPLIGDITYTGLVEGDEFNYNLDGVYETDSISIDIPGTFTCTDVNIQNNTLGLDVTDCYDISYANDYGYVHIKALPLTITSNSLSTTYDGTVFSATSENPQKLLSVEAVGLQEGHQLNVAFDYEGTMFLSNSVSNTFTYNVIDTATSQDVTHLYLATPVYGTLSTAKRDLYVTFDSGEWVFDGASHLADHYDANGLADGDTIEFTSDYPSVTYYGSINNSRDFYISRSGSPVSDYYNIHTTYGTLNVTKKELTISYSVPESKMYDAEPISIDPSDVTVSGLDTSAFRYELSMNYGSIERYQQGGYDIRISSLEIYRIDDIYGNNPLSGNFTFNYQGSKFNSANNLMLGHVDISKRPLHVSSKTLEKVYDGVELNSESDGIAYIYEEGDLLSAKGHYLQFYSGSSQTLVGSTTNSITLRVFDAYSNDITDCYDMSGAYMTLGTLTVTQNDSLVITFPNITSKEYNGSNQVPDRTFTSENLGMGDEISVSYKAMMLNAGEYPLADCFNINITRSSADVNYCYKNITLIGNPFVITKFDLTITMHDINRGLDSSNFPNANSNRNISREIPDTDALDLQYPSNALEMVEEGIYPTPTYTITNKTNGQDRLSNYNITLIDGTANVDLIELELWLSDTGFSYLGSPINYGNGETFWSYDWMLLSSYNCNITGLQAEVETEEFKEPGTYSVKAINTEDIRITRFNNSTQQQEDVTAYFKLVFKSLTCNAVIYKQRIEIYQLEVEKTYDGKEIFTGYSGSMASPDHHLEIVNSGAQSIIKPGTITNVINDESEVVIKDGQGNDVSYLYDIIIDPSVLGQTIRTTVNPYEITVETRNHEKAFDGTVFKITDFYGYDTVFTHYYGNYSQSTRYYEQVYTGITADCYAYLPTGDTIYYTYPVFANYHVQVVDNEVDIQILDSNGNDVKDCYNITTNFGTLTISSLEYSYTTNANNKTYSGTSYSLTDYLNKKDSNFINFDVNNLPEELLDYINSNKDNLYAQLTAGDGDFVVGSYSVTPTFVFIYNGDDLVAMGDIIFTGGNVSSTIGKRSITINNIQNQIAYISSRYPSASEELEYVGLASGDVLYIGEEEWSDEIEDYAIIPNMTENRTYTASELATYLTVSDIHIYRTVKGVRYDVTNCYNIQLVFYDIRVINNN